jgi:hypothetical protein
MRTTIDLRPDQIERLGRYCARNRISQAEAIRKAVDALLPPDDEAELREALDSTFGMWADRTDIDGVEYQRALRAQWDR